MPEESHNLGGWVWKEPRVRVRVRSTPISHLSPLPVENQWWAVGGEAGNWDSLFSSGLSFFLGAGRPITWRTSPMDKGRTEPCGRVTSKTHISNTGAILNPDEIWVGVDFPEDSWKQVSWSHDAKASHCGRMIEYEPAKVRSLFFYNHNCTSDS